MALHPLLTLLLLSGELVFSAAALLVIFRFRDWLGLGPLFLLLGANQVLSVVLASSVYFRLTPTISVSPGSVILFPTALAAVLLVYLREDIPKTRTLIYSVVLINVGGTILLWMTAFQMQVLEVENLLGVPLALFAVKARVFFAGTVGLLLDFLLLIILYQFLERRAAWLPRSARVVLSLVAILCFDSIFFTVGAFYGEPAFSSVLAGQIAGKSSAGMLYGILIALYLYLVEPNLQPLKIRTESLDVLSILTYQERYEIVRQKLDEAREASLAKTRFLAHMSHELRTPLNAIIGFTKLLITPASVPETDKRLLYLDRVHDNAQHLLRLINNMLDLSKIEAGKIELERRRVDLAELAAETVGQMRVQARDKGLEILIEEANGRLVLETDPTRLKQILINLIGNAIKFTQDGKICVRLVPSAIGGGAPQRIDVIDTGIGIPEHLHESVFEAFAQAESGTTRSYEGTGLGLAISQALCNELGYRLEVESAEGHGSTFSVVFEHTPQASAGS